MNKDYTHITVVLDRSGSMSSVWQDTIGGLESLISDNKKEKSKCTFSLYSFNHKIENPIKFTDIQIVSESVSDYGITPSGNTALYDAIGQAIQETGEKLKSLPEKERPARVMVVIQTDGQENSSSEYKANTIKKLVKEQTDKYNWVFNFIGSSQESVLDATTNLGFNSNTTAFYSSTNTDGTFDLLKTKMVNARSISPDQYAKAMCFTSDEKEILKK